MGSKKDTTYALINYLEGHETINEVTYGSANEFDIKKSSKFPLAHVIHPSLTISEGFTTFNYEIWVVDLYRSSRDEIIEIQDNMVEVIQHVHKALVSGSLFQNYIRTSVNSSADVIYDERQNRVYGYSLSLAVTVPSNIEICV